MKKILLISLFLTIFCTKNSYSASSKWFENQNGTKVQIISSYYDDENKNKKLILGIHFKIKDGWKIYGQGSSGIGFPPIFDFSQSQNIKNHEIFLPKAILQIEEIAGETYEYYVYKDEVIFPISIEEKNLNDKTIINLEIDYGLCKDVCVPVHESLQLKISDEKDEKSLRKIQKFFESKIVESKLQLSKNPSLNQLLYIALIAILGGAILNIMPCVLPVLSIKIISIINHSNAPISRIRIAFISTIFGILFCFVFLASIATIIKLTGNSFDWGLQFQNPYFLIALFLILIAFVGNLLGLFEINFNGFLANFLNKRIQDSEQKHRVIIPNFLSGILAVLLATPCSAPFLGTAITFALTQNISSIFVVFLAIGVGFSLPYFILLITPRLVYLLPKTGSWMFSVKKLMAGFLMATLIWILYILMNNIGFILAIGVSLIGIALLKILSTKQNIFKIIAIIILAFSSFLIPLKSERIKQEKQITKQFENNLWQKFNEAEIANYVKEGKTVIVDITADWCITCKFNKLRVFNNKEVIAKLKDGQIIAMRGDITIPDKKIMDYLHKNNRFAIPFNAVYGPNAKNGIITKVVLSKEEFFQTINNAQISND